MVRGLAIILAACLLLLTGCGAVATPGASPGEVPLPPASQELIGQGMVISDEDGPVMLCLGPVMESYPPQCSGPEVIGWDWEAVKLWERAGGVTWGTYAVHGTWNGETFTLTRPPTPLALYDPPANIDPRTEPANSGAGNHAELEAVQQDLLETAGERILTSWIENGYVFVTVVYDDGTLQDSYDASYGENMVAVQSALQPVNPD